MGAQTGPATVATRDAVSANISAAPYLVFEHVRRAAMLISAAPLMPASAIGHGGPQLLWRLRGLLHGCVPALDAFALFPTIAGFSTERLSLARVNK